MAGTAARIPPDPPTSGEKGGSKGATKVSKGSQEKEVSDESFKATSWTAINDFSRDQQLKLAKLLAGSLGATLSFPNAKEASLRRELTKVAQKASAKSGQQQTQAAKPENAALKGSAVEKSLREAQKKLQAKKLELGLPKDSEDSRLSEEIKAVKTANDAFQRKKEEILKTLRN
jgi:hypothetical protein